jgi:hypothetical protein
MKTNNLCADIGYLSLEHVDEVLCADRVKVADDPARGTTVLIVDDGLNKSAEENDLLNYAVEALSATQASMSNFEDALRNIAQKIRCCATKEGARSSFTVFHVSNNGYVCIIQYDNPGVILMRDGRLTDVPCEIRTVSDMPIKTGVISVAEGDEFFLAMNGDKRIGFNADEPLSITLNKAKYLHKGETDNPASFCCVRIRDRKTVNLLFGPPRDRSDCKRMMDLFFSNEGRYIVCGGTSAGIASDYLKKPLKTSILYLDPEIPPTAEIEGVDLVTEGAITVKRVLDYAKNHLEDNSSYGVWSQGQDGASKIARMLFEEATDINFFVGRAINPAHQDPKSPISFNVKMKLVEELADCLKKMGKKIKVSYF